MTEKSLLPGSQPRKEIVFLTLKGSNAMTEISVNNEIKELPASPSKGIYMDDRLQNSLFAPDKAEHYQKLAMMLAKTDLVPPTYKNKPMELFIAMAHGYALGLTVEQSIQDI